MRVILDGNPLAPTHAAPEDFAALYRSRPAWAFPQQAGLPPEVTAYRLRCDVPVGGRVRVHVSADERYELFVDGHRIGRGPERGSDRVWYFESYDLDLSPGPLVLTALVWRLGDLGPLAQVGLAGGLLVEAEGPLDALLSTRSGAWEAKVVEGIRFSKASVPGNGAWFAGPGQTLDGPAYAWGVEHGEGDGWAPVLTRHEDGVAPYGIRALHPLQPATLPAQLERARRAGCVRFAAAATWADAHAVPVPSGGSPPEETAAWQAMVDRASSVVVPPRARRMVILDLEDYVCAYTRLLVSGGAGSRVSIGWAEALHLADDGRHKGHRDGVEGRCFVAPCHDVLVADGGAARIFEPLWWRAGRYLQLLVETGDEPLEVKAFELRETRYPLEIESQFDSSDKRLQDAVPVVLRGLQMCAHETYVDCPYYEQMMYVGDSRLEALATYVISTDARLPRKAIELFGLSRLPDGMIQARYPGRDVQVIPPFSLWWVGMVHDHALWRGDRDFVAATLPGVRAVLDGFLAGLDGRQLLRAPGGWNFADWVPDWPLGVPPQASDGFSGLLNWHLVYTLALAVRLEAWAGEPELAQRWQRWCDTLVPAIQAAFWDADRALFADDLTKTRFSEHTQCLALLSGRLSSGQQAAVAAGLLHSATLTRTTIYFAHYLFEAYRLLQQPGALLSRMELWFGLAAQGFKTTPEQPEPSRSDCHGWGAHLLYHCFASLLGIRPASLGFESVEIEPQPGPLRHLSGRMVHPRGRIVVDLRFDGGAASGVVELPPGVGGVLRMRGQVLRLVPGLQEVRIG